MKRVLLVLCAFVMLLTSCNPAVTKPKDHLVENEDYLDLSSQYDGESFDYNESLWYMNKLKDVPHPDLTDEEFLAITSSEISTNQRCDCDFFFSKTYHLNIYSPDENKSSFNTFDKSKMWLEHSYGYITDEQEKQVYNRRYDVDDVNKVIEMANAEGCLVSYNHPVWSLQDYSDYIDLKGLWGVELYNTGCARNGYFDSAKPLDDLLTALKNGDFYASTGPEFYEISIEGSKVKVITSPAAFVGLSTDCRQLYAKRDEKNLLTEVCFDIDWYFRLSKDGPNEHQYIRITAVDEFGNEAYSRAYYMEELTDENE